MNSLPPQQAQAIRAYNRNPDVLAAKTLRPGITFHAACNIASFVFSGRVADPMAELNKRSFNEVLTLFNAKLEHMKSGVEVAYDELRRDVASEKRLIHTYELGFMRLYEFYQFFKSRIVDRMYLIFPEYTGDLDVAADTAHNCFSFLCSQPNCGDRQKVSYFLGASTMALMHFAGYVGEAIQAGHLMPDLQEEDVFKFSRDFSEALNLLIAFGNVVGVPVEFPKVQWTASHDTA